MCGICASVTFSPVNNEGTVGHFKNETYKFLTECLQRRGPDSFNKVSHVFKGKFDLLFCSSVLHLRGSDITVQPIVNDRKNLLMWNGEIFDGSLIETKSDSSNTISDTSVLAEKLFCAETTFEVLQLLSCIKGPFAFIYFHADGLIWFGRDIFGRRSLLWKFEDSVFQLCSLAANTHNAKWEEVPTVGIFCLDLNLSSIKGAFVMHQYAWSSAASGDILRKQVELPVPSTIAEIRLSSDFSIQVPISESLNRNVPSDSSASDLLCLLTDLQSSKLTKQEILQKILDLHIFVEVLNSFETVLSHAVKKRVEDSLRCCRTCYCRLSQDNSFFFCDHSYAGVLFSGGLDSIVIACLVDKYVDSRCSIDLINVAFASQKNIESRTNGSHFDTPDRVTGKIGYQALKDLSPCRKWKFVEEWEFNSLRKCNSISGKMAVPVELQNISYELILFRVLFECQVNIMDSELNYKREHNISELLYPSCTVLDDSIGCALWFASRGEGFITDDGETISYKSPSRILLVGMGADEQLAGYSRHRGKFKNAGWDGLVEEIAVELDRIGSRNLGRDDRIIADSGVESRYPFLDENVVSFLNSLPIWFKANLNLDRGLGEKLLLRLLAFRLGLTEAAVLPKRAIQFGSRIAKLENPKEKGSDVCTRLLPTSC